jgi:hypothetical protein
LCGYFTGVSVLDTIFTGFCFALAVLLYLRSNVESLKGRNNFEDMGVDKRILKWILKKNNGTVWHGFIRQGRAQ